MSTANSDTTRTGAKDSPNYWLFQANPRTGFDLHDDLRTNGRSGWWRVTRPFSEPRLHLRPGDKVVLWQVEGNRPDAAGVYGIGEITRPPYRAGGGWRAWYRMAKVRTRDSRILASSLRADSALKEVSAFRQGGAQGSNFRLSRAQWERISSYFDTGAGRRAVKAFEVQTHSKDEPPNLEAFVSLKDGIARIGWSGKSSFDLRKLEQLKKAGRLSPSQRQAWKGNHEFLKAENGSLLFYRDAPDYKRVTVVRLTGDYEYRAAWNGKRWDDFRSCRACTVLVSGRPLADFPSALRPCLTTQGRFYEIRKPSALAAMRRMFASESLPPGSAKTSEDSSNRGGGRILSRLRREAVLKKVLGYSYIAEKKRIRVAQRHETYKHALKAYLEDRDGKIQKELKFEEDYIDVSFRIGKRQFLGEIKVTDPPTEAGPFRMALGQLQEYRFTKFRDRADPILFIDRPIEAKRLQLASRLGVAVVVNENRSFRLLNPDVNRSLRALFR